MRPDLPSKLHDTIKANGVHYLVLSTTNNGHIEISFMARVVAYFLILGLLIIVVSVLFKCLGVFRSEWGTEEAAEPDTTIIVIKFQKLQNSVSSIQKLFDGEGHIEISFMARVVTYFLILGLLIIVVSVLFKCLGVFRSEWGTEEAAEPDIESQANPLMSEKDAPCSYGTMEDDSDSSLCCNSPMDLYDGKICVICYDGRRNCFFIPCGHSATCYTCAQKITEGENKVCPICRRLVHKVRRLFAI